MPHNEDNIAQMRPGPDDGWSPIDTSSLQPRDICARLEFRKS